MNDIREIRGVGQVISRRMQDAGYDSVERIAQAAPEELSELLGLPVSVTSKMIKSAAEVWNVLQKSATEEESEEGREEPAAPLVEAQEEPAPEKRKELRTQLYEKLLSDPSVTDALYKDLASEAAALIRPQVEEKLLEVAMTYPAFRKRLVAYTVDKLD